MKSIYYIPGDKGSRMFHFTDKKTAEDIQAKICTASTWFGPPVEIPVFEAGDFDQQPPACPSCGHPAHVGECKEGWNEGNGVIVTCGCKPPACPECGHPAHEGKECDATVRYDDYLNTFCRCKPADQKQKHCKHSWVKRNEGTNLVTYLECIYCKTRKPFDQPTPEMPLISNKQICALNQIEKCHIVEPDLSDLLIAQRDADMAWHNEQKAAIRAQAYQKGFDKGKLSLSEDYTVQVQAAVKEFAEKLIATMPESMPDITWKGFQAKTHILEDTHFSKRGSDTYKELVTAYKLGKNAVIAHIRAEGGIE